MKAIPGQVKGTVTDAWGMLKFALNPDDPRSMDMVVDWSFGRMDVQEIVHAINTKQDIASEFQHWVDTDATKMERNITLAVINAQWVNLSTVLMDPRLILEYFDRFSPEKAAYLRTPQGIAYLNWICPRFHAAIEKYVYHPDGHTAKKVQKKHK